MASSLGVYAGQISSGQTLPSLLGISYLFDFTSIDLAFLLIFNAFLDMFTLTRKEKQAPVYTALDLFCTKFTYSVG